MAPHVESTRVETDDSDSARKVRAPRKVKSLWQLPSSTWKPFGSPPKSWWPDALLLLGVTINTVFLIWPSPMVEFDSWVRQAAYDYKIEWLRQVALFISNLGSGRFAAPLVVALAVWCAIRARSFRPFLMFTAGFAGLGGIFILKNLFGRPLSHHPFLLSLEAPDGPLLFDYIGRSTAYPSGHAANTIVFYGLAILLLGGVVSARVRWLILLAPPILVVVSQIYAGYHWLFDAPAGFMLGVLIIRAVRRVPWTEIPLGPLQRFEPASPRLVIESSILIVGFGLCATLPRVQAAMVAAVVLVVGVIWAVIRWRQAAPESAR